LLDAALAPFMTTARATHALLVGYPGRVGSDARGFVSVTRSDVAPDEAIVAAEPTLPMQRLEDVAPTVLHALGVPVSQELTGAPLPGAFEMSEDTTRTIRVVASYGRRSIGRAGTGDEPMDEEMRERLRSLGYVR
jgi:hypothetical protein